MEFISPVMKDRVLNYLLHNCPLESYVTGETKDLLAVTETSFDNFNAILNQFQRYGFIAELGVRESYTSFVVQAELHDFALKGGFVAKEEIFEANIQKLDFEIELLKTQLGPQHLEKFEKISSITASLITFMQYAGSAK